jgi:hypothetical protein
MPRQKNLLTLIREIVRAEVTQAVDNVFGTLMSAKPKATNGRRTRRRTRGTWRPGGPGRPPKAVAAKMAAAKPRRKKRRGSGRPKGPKNRK